MKMVTKLCVSCGLHAWHNIRVKEGKILGERCTYCGYPVGTHGDAGRRETAELVRKRQVAKLK
mgnify:CR=1 FL=1